MPYVKCKVCDEKMYAKPRHLKIGWGKYCSRKCQYIAQLKGRMIKCEVCEKDIWKTPANFAHSVSGKFFCNKSCQSKWRNNIFSGPRHSRWKGGEWAYRAILSRQENILKVCNLCETIDTRVLAVHHINKNHKDNNIQNLAWLCHNCHFLVHHYDDE